MNAVDCPQIYQQFFSCAIVSRLTDRPGRWEPFYFLDRDQPVPTPFQFLEHPSLLAPNYQVDDWRVYTLTVANHRQRQLGIVYSSQSQTYLWDRDVGSVAETRFSRIAYNRYLDTTWTADNSFSNQWVGCDYLNHPADRLERTADGWLTYEVANQNNGLPGGSAFYSLSLAEFAETASYGAAVLTSDVISGDRVDAHIEPVVCDGLYFTSNRGDSWIPVAVPGWDELLYNVQVAMSFDKVYLLGIKVLPGQDPEIFCRWGTYAFQGGQWVWNWRSPTDLGDLRPGSKEKPKYPFDLVVLQQGNPPNRRFHLFAATEACRNAVFFVGRGLQHLTRDHG